MIDDVLHTQVVVVGAGPVGLLLAAELRLGGAQVLVLDRLARPTTESRASTVHARTMEIFRMRGLLGELGTIPHDNAGHFGGIPLDFGGLATSFPGQWKVAQARIEELLTKRVVDLGGTILREHEVRDVVDHDDHVELSVACPGGPLRVLAEYAVGCDGERSTVADAAGFERVGTGRARMLLRCDVVGIEIPNRRFHRLPAGLAVAGKLPGGVTRVMVHEFGRPPLPGPPCFADVVAAWARVTGEDIGAGTSLWVNAFGDESRQALSYRRGRVLLAGDAAHVQMPAGGQALNLGLHDAMNLGWKLAAQVRGRAPEGLLDSYHDERHPVGARVLSNIRAQGLILLGGPEVGAFRDLLGELIAQPAVTDHLAAMISGLDVRYGDAEHPLVGARMPGGDIAEAAQALQSGRGVLSGPLSGRLAAAARPWGDRVRTARSPVLAGLGSDEALLARPDGYVAWIGGDRRSLRTSLYQWFGPPS